MGSDTNTRTALLALQAEPDAPHSGRRIVEGASVLERQIDVALALGCTRIWLFAPKLDAVALKAQKLAEQGGAQFRLVQRGRQLLGSLRQQDELLVMAEGLLPAEREGLDLVQETSGILRLSAEEGAQGGFERLDRDYCWAGVMILPGRVLERLEELGDDIDPVSALLRAGRVNRVDEKTLPAGWLSDGKWSLMPTKSPVNSEHIVERERTDFVTQTIASPLGKWLAPRRNLAIGSGLLAAILAISALVLLNLGLPALALCLIVVAGILAKIWLQSRHHSDVRVFSGKRRNLASQPITFAVDAIGVTALAIGLSAGFDWYSTGYIAFLTCGVWAIAAYTPGRLSRFFRDRAPLWLGCAVAGFAGQWFAGAAVLTGVALLGIVVNLRNQPTITQV